MIIDLNFKYNDYGNIAVINPDNPDMDLAFQKEIKDKTNAVILITFATGTFPFDAIPKIKETIERDIPVFLLSNDPGDTHGIMRLKSRFSAKLASRVAMTIR